MNLRSLSPKQLKELKNQAKRTKKETSAFTDLTSEIVRRQKEKVKLNKAI